MDYHSTGEGSSRKRLKISNDTGRPADRASANTPEVVSLISSPAKLKATTEVPNGVHTNGSPCHHEQSLQTLLGDLDSMRQLITCKICQRFLYEPFALTCGHTFCYTCLCQWMGQKHKKTCPDCRMDIKHQPAPSYLIREMVLIFVSKSELLPDGETAEEHNRDAKEEADIVAQDKANTDFITGGLFKGAFRSGSAQMPLIAVRDHSDHVDRCPQCTQEVLLGRCSNCNVRVRTEDEDSDEENYLSEVDWDNESEEEIEDDLFDQEAEAEPGSDDDMPERYMYDGDRIVEIDTDEDDSEMEQFIVGDDQNVYSIDSDDEPASDATEVPYLLGGRLTTYVTDSDDEPASEAAEVSYVSRRRVRTGPSDSESDDGSSVFERQPSQNVPSPSVGASDSSSDDEDDDEPVSTSQRSRLRNGFRSRRRPVRVVSDDEDEDDESEAAPATGRSSPRSSSSPFTGFVEGEVGFSPLQYDGESEDEAAGGPYLRPGSVDFGSSEDSMDEDEGDAEDHDDEDDEDDEEVGDIFGARIETDDSDGHQSDGSDESDDQNTNDQRLPEISYSHRLHTCGPRSSRRADFLQTGTSTRPPSYRMNPASTAARTFRSPNAAYRPVLPRHPFNLEDTLARLRRSGQEGRNDNDPSSSASTSSSRTLDDDY